jgi:phosphate:Na+ symporter
MLPVNNIKLIFYILLLFLTVFAKSVLAQEADSIIIPAIDSSKVILVNAHPQRSDVPVTETSHQTAGKILENPFKVQVLDNGKEPVEGWPVYFSVISTPQKAEGTKLTDLIVYTDENGFAESSAMLGSQSGVYEFAARIRNGSDQFDIVYFKAYARKADWVFYLVSGLIGGLGLFLFGMGMMSDGMKKTAGSRMRTLLGTITNNRIIAVTVGAFVTMIIQSSSATTVMLVSFVQAQIMTFAQSLGVILGADIGTTITAQLIAFKLTDYSLIVIGIGFGMMILFKSKKIKSVGEAVLGFGLLFFGMWIMSSSMEPLTTYDPFINILLELENPLLGIILGIIFTAIIQSSAAFTGIIIVLGSQGLITLDAAIPLLLGANIGTSITAALASINTGREAKRVALANTLFKVFGVSVIVWWIPYYAELIRWISPSGTEGLVGIEHLADVVPRQIANAHTIFNVGLTLIVLPFTNQAAKLVCKLLPDKAEPEDEGEFKTKYLENSLVSTPTLALNLAKAETISMANKVQTMVEKILTPFFKYDEDIIDEIRDTETEVNFLNVHINKYLMKISQQSLAEERTDEIFQIMHSVTELEQIGDIIVKRLIPLAEKKMLLNTQFSQEGQDEIKDYHLRTMKQISRAIEVFKDVNLKDAKRMEKKYKKYRLMEMDLRRTHFDRLRSDVPETVATSEIHLELIELLKRISSNATNIARLHLELRSDQEEEANLKVKLSKIEKKKKKIEKDESDGDDTTDGITG